MSLQFQYDASTSHFVNRKNQLLWIDMPWYSRLLHIIKQVPCYILLFLFPFFSSCCPWSRDVSIILYFYCLYLEKISLKVYVEREEKFNLFIYYNFSGQWSWCWTKPCSMVRETMGNTIKSMHIHRILLYDIFALYNSICIRSSTSSHSLDRYSYCNLDYLVYVPRYWNRYNDINEER